MTFLTENANWSAREIWRERERERETERQSENSWGENTLDLPLLVAPYIHENGLSAQILKWHFMILP
jgi:hypothetical protein